MNYFNNNVKRLETEIEKLERQIRHIDIERQNLMDNKTDDDG